MLLSINKLLFVLCAFLFFSAPQEPVENVSVLASSRTILLDVTPPSIVTGLFTYDLIFSSSNRTSITVEDVSSTYNFTGFAPNTFYKSTVSNKIKNQQKVLINAQAVWRDASSRHCIKRLFNCRDVEAVARLSASLYVSIGRPGL